MKPEEKKHTAEALTEKSSWMRVGLLPILLKPLTLGQIYEMGEYTCQMEGAELDRKSQVLASVEMLTRHKSAKLMQEVFLVCAYRKRWKRRLFRHYILKRLTVSGFQKALSVITNAYTASFFLTSIIFLHQTNGITEPSQTTARGQQSEA